MLQRIHLLHHASIDIYSIDSNSSCADEALPEPELRSSPASADIPELGVSLELPRLEQDTGNPSVRLNSKRVAWCAPARATCFAALLRDLQLQHKTIMSRGTELGLVQFLCARRWYTSSPQGLKMAQPSALAYVTSGHTWATASSASA